MKATLLHKIPCALGEGAFWHETRRSFFWVDIDNRALHEVVRGKPGISTWNFAHKVTMIACDERDNMILAGQGRIARFDPVSQKMTTLLNLDEDKPGMRTNDGGVDAAGRLWVGTMHASQGPVGTLYRISNDLTIRPAVEKLSVPNGLAWSLDGLTMYHIDSPTQQVKAYAFDPATGDIRFERVAIEVPEELGTPDGMCIDAEGMLWIAHWNGFGVYRWNPGNGTMLQKIEVPVPQVSCCAFGGDNLDKLFITTAREHFTPEDAKRHPDSGSVYLVQPGVCGVRKKRVRFTEAGLA